MIQSTAFCYVFTSITPGSHTVVDFISWASRGHQPSCADSDPRSSHPACTLSSEKGQKEISQRQPLQVPRPLEVHPGCTRRKHSAKCALAGVYCRLAIEESLSLCSWGDFHRVCKMSTWLRQNCKASPFPPGSSRKAHSGLEIPLSPSGITRSVSSWEEVRGDRTLRSLAQGHPLSPRPHGWWGFSRGDSGYSNADSPKPEALLFTQVTLPTPRTPPALLKGALKVTTKEVALHFLPRAGTGFQRIPRPLNPGPTKTGETAASRPPSEGRINPFICAAFFFPALADTILQTALPRLCQGPGARPPPHPTPTHPGRWWSPAAKHTGPASLVETFIPAGNLPPPTE